MPLVQASSQNFSLHIQPRSSLLSWGNLHCWVSTVPKSKKVFIFILWQNLFWIKDRAVDVFQMYSTPPPPISTNSNLKIDPARNTCVNSQNLRVNLFLVLDCLPWTKNLEEDVQPLQILYCDQPVRRTNIRRYPYLSEPLNVSICKISFFRRFCFWSSSCPKHFSWTHFCFFSCSSVSVSRWPSYDKANTTKNKYSWTPK